jgi:hypothetical protein
MAEHLFRLTTWIVCAVLIGLFPMFVTWWIEMIQPKGRDYLRDFYWEGAFLFLGPAIVGELCAELTVKRTLFDDQFLSTIAIIVAFGVLIGSALTYSAMMSERAARFEHQESLQNGPVLTMIKEVSDGILISSAVFAFSVTAVLYGAN